MSSTNIYTSSTNIPIYVSLTSIFKNQDVLLQTLTSIVNQSKIPDKIFVYLSEEPYILDSGFKDKHIKNTNLLTFINDHSIIDLKWVKNIGSYRKLIPLLKEKWHEDCFIITIDDDTVYDKNLIENLVNDYNKQKCVICYRTFSLKFKTYDTFNYASRHKHTQFISLYNFPTGKGGILYKPEFFHKTNDLIFNDNIFLKTCDKQDDIWFYIIRILNNINSYTDNKPYCEKDISSSGLYIHFNRKNNYSPNNNAFINTINELKNLNIIHDSSIFDQNYGSIEYETKLLKEKTMKFTDHNNF